MHKRRFITTLSAMNCSVKALGNENITLPGQLIVSPPTLHRCTNTVNLIVVHLSPGQETRRVAHEFNSARPFERSFVAAPPTPWQEHSQTWGVQQPVVPEEHINQLYERGAQLLGASLQPRGVGPSLTQPCTGIFAGAKKQPGGARITSLSSKETSCSCTASHTTATQ